MIDDCPRPPLPPGERRARALALLHAMELALAECDGLHLLAVGARLSGALDLMRAEVARLPGFKDPAAG